MFGSKLGFPWTLAPAKILMVVAPGKGAATDAEAGVPPVDAVEVPVPIADTGGGFLAKLCQFGIAIAAPTAITPTRTAMPCHILLPVVLGMALSSCVVIILLRYR